MGPCAAASEWARADAIEVVEHGNDRLAGDASPV